MEKAEGPSGLKDSIDAKLSLLWFCDQIGYQYFFGINGI
jgi:hypothetical protein